MHVKLRNFFTLTALLVLAVLASGCMVRAVYPWLRAEDITFEENLLGGWIGKSDTNEVAMTFVRREKNSYEVQYSDGEKHGVFLGKLAKFGSDYYLDFKPKDNVPGLEGLLQFPTHSAAWLEISRDSLVIHPLDYDKFVADAKLERLRDLRFAWGEDENQLILTSKTEDLQRFLLALGHDSIYFGTPIKLARRK
jgi:hypothetical protein